MKLYHVTFKKNIPSIKKKGLVPSKKALFKGAFGQDIRDAIAVYAFNELDDAIRWAFKLNFDTKKEVAIVVFDQAGKWEKDTHWQAAMAKGEWLKSVTPVVPENIIKVINQTTAFKQLKRLARSFEGMERLKEVLKLYELTVPQKHQLKIAKDTLKMPDAMVGVMGGMNKDQARKFLKSIGWKDSQIKKLEK